MSPTLRRAAQADAAAIGPIILAAFNSIADKHNFPRDFPNLEMTAGFAQMLVSDPRIFGVVVESGGRVVGSNFLFERDPIVGVGPITVDPTFQGKGAGRKLMQAVLDRAREIKAPGVRLVQDAFNTTSMPLYASLGFDVKEPLALMHGHVSGEPEQGTQARALREADVPACAALCEKVHGISREKELRDAVAHLKPVVLERGGKIVAYATNPTLWFLNHGVAESEADMHALLVSASRLLEQPLFFLLPTRQANLFRWCLSRGLRMLKPMSLMAIGEYHEPRGAWYPSVLF